MTTAHEAIFNAINGVHRDPQLSFTAANAVLESLKAAGFVVVVSVQGASRHHQEAGDE